MSIIEDLARLSDAARPGPWVAYETMQADNFIVREGEGLLNGPGPIMGPSYDKTTVEYVVALVNAHRAGLLAALPETPTTDDREAMARVLWEAAVRDNPEGVPGDTWKGLCSDEPEWADGFRAQADAALAFRRPSPPTEEPPRTVTFANVADVEALFVVSGDPEMVFVNAINDHLIVGLSEDGECFYQGVPEALNEEGTKVDPRRGWLRDLRESEWPLTLMVKAEAAARVGGEG